MGKRFYNLIWFFMFPKLLEKYKQSLINLYKGKIIHGF